MKIFFLGDFRANDGPGVANRAIRRTLGDQPDIRYSEAVGVISRIWEILKKSFCADIICICSFTRLNLLGIWCAKRFNRRVVYRMHGFCAYEESINHDSLSEKTLRNIEKQENYIFSNVDKIIGVSQLSMEQLSKLHPQFRHKLCYCYNSVNLSAIQSMVEKCQVIRKKRQVISVGGGLKIKNNLMICKAIEKINNNKQFEVKYLVIGTDSEDTELIKKFKFVEYYSSLSHESVIQKMCESALYVQNSLFETFGLAIVEALLAGCHLLISAQSGVLELLESREEQDIIYDSRNLDEIAMKIENLLCFGNNKRLTEGLKKDLISEQRVADTLVREITCFNR